MTETGKRVEVRYGTFACRIEGYDDPAEQMRGILSVMQRAIAETPELADEGGLDEAQIARIEHALFDGGAAEGSTVPGLVVIRGGGDTAGDGESPAPLPPGHEAELHGAPATGGVLGAPAAAAEAAYAAGMAAEDDLVAEAEPAGATPVASDAADPDDDADDAPLADEAAAQVLEPAHADSLAGEGDAERWPGAPSAGSDGAQIAPQPTHAAIPAINIFAPPPDHAVPCDSAEARGPEGAGDAVGGEDGAGDLWGDGASGDAEDETHHAQLAGADATAENRFAAMITRYQNTRPQQSAADSALEPETSISAEELARRAGSDSVTDLLTASAAWLTLARAKERFTRREVMDVFETLPGDHPRTLEARIKGFGQLVRSRVIVLVEPGIFSLSEDERDRFRALTVQG